MEKQHQSMNMVNRQWQAFHKALHEGNLKTADKALEQMLAATLSLEDFKPHRNANKRQQFLERGRMFREKVVKLRDALKGGDDKQAQELEKAAGDDCVLCHTMFK